LRVSSWVKDQRDVSDVNRIAHLSLRLKMFQFGSFGHQGNSDFFKSMRRRQMRASSCQARASQRNFAEVASNFTNHDGLREIYRATMYEASFPKTC
jgi:hypothetical protein